MFILSEYLKFTDDTEPPKQYHRWAFITCAAAKIERNLYIPFGPGYIYPNLYTMLVGVPGTRKSSSIKLAQKILKTSGYNTFSYTKTSKQKFLIDMEEGIHPKKLDGTIDILKALETPLDKEWHCNFICCDEFADFIGQSNIDFINLLTTLWDNLDEYDERLKNSLSVHLKKPSVCLLGGVTPVSFAQCIPQEVGGQGFLSRTILVYGEPNGKKVTWPRTPSPEEFERFEIFMEQLGRLAGEVTVTDEARSAVDDIYQQWENLPDIRLQYYGGRRLTHMLKICIVFAAFKAIHNKTTSVVIDTDIVVAANTVLTYTEEGMSDALGELGKSKFSEATQKIVESLANAGKPVNLESLWQVVNKDLENVRQLHEILHNLKRAKKIEIVQGESGSSELISPMIMLVKSQSNKDLPHVDYKKYIDEYEERHETVTILQPKNRQN